MPDVSRMFIKTALVYLAAALLVGVVLAPPVAARAPELVGVKPAYIHLLVVGWLTQLIFGVAYWLFPRHSRETPYGNQRLPWLSFVLLNLGLVLRVVSEPAQAWHPAMIWEWGLGLAAVSQWLAGTVFAAYLWTRVKVK